ncbi:hypothetical protein J5Y09_17675 [Roseomonas sp. PWR1]|uniref:Uncharacterized protein n=1 Tax=Roseomonas nitratireducens TaxID=2820810 RepID=A0ABS4AZ00_9PROT|nr:hypothetical protein [Neoroseomonas nitratireducens]MBP0465762.1 hypothetical protein [Neoroseomonas nitratireducens]
MDASATPTRLLPQFLAWVAARPRSYDQAMEAWRSNCPCMSIWEDSLAEGLVRVDAAGMVALTEAGRRRLAACAAAS